MRLFPKHSTRLHPRSLLLAADVEGAEYPLVRHLVNTGAACRLDQIGPNAGTRDNSSFPLLHCAQKTFFIGFSLRTVESLEVRRAEEFSLVANVGPI